MAEHEFEMIMRETTVTTYRVRTTGDDRVGARNAAENGIVTHEEEISVISERVVDWLSMKQLPEPTEEKTPTAVYERAEVEIRQLLEKQAALVSARHAQRKADAASGTVDEIEEGRLPDLCSSFTLTVKLPLARASDSGEMRVDEILLAGEVVYSVDYDRVYFLAATLPNNGSTRTGRFVEFGEEGEMFPQFFKGAIEFHLWNLAKDAAKQGCDLSAVLSTTKRPQDVVLEETDAFSLPEVIKLKDWQHRQNGTAPAPM